MKRMLKALDKRGIEYQALFNDSAMSGTIIHSTLGLEVEFLIQFENGKYILMAWYNDYHLETIERKTLKAIVDNIENIMKGLPWRLDRIEMAKWEIAMEI